MVLFTIAVAMLHGLLKDLPAALAQPMGRSTSAVAQPCTAAESRPACMALLPECRRYVQELTSAPAGPTSDPERDRALSQLATCESMLSQHSEAEQRYRQLLEIRERRFSANSLEVASTLVELGLMLSAQGKQAEAEPFLRRALATRQQRLGAAHDDTLVAARVLGLALYSQEKYAAAVPMFRQILTAFEKQFGPEDLRTAMAQRNLGMLLAYSVDTALEAQRLLRRALLVQRTQLGAEHLVVVETMRTLARNLRNGTQDAEAEDLFRRVLAIRERALGPESPDLAENLFELADHLETQKKYVESETHYRRRLAILERHHQQPNLKVAMAVRSVAFILELQKRWSEAESYHRRDLDIRQSLFGEEHPHVATSLVNLANNLDTQSQSAAAEPLLLRALAIRQKLLGDRHQDLQKILPLLQRVYAKQGKSSAAIDRLSDEIEDRFPCDNIFRLQKESPEFFLAPERGGSSRFCERARSVFQLAQCQSQAGRYASAESHFRSLLGCRASSAPHLLLLPQQQVLAALGWAVENQGRYAEAEQLYRSALDSSRKAHGPTHPEIAAILNELAGAVDAQGRYGDAEQLHRQALTMRQQMFGEKHAQVSQSLSNLAQTVRHLGGYKESETLYQRALSMAQEVHGSEHPDYATVLEGWVVHLQKDGRFSEAERYGRQVLEIRQRALGPDHPDVATALDNLSQALIGQGNYGEAERLSRAALALSQRVMGNDHPVLAVRFHNLAINLSQQGRNEEAEQLIRKALALTQKEVGTEHPGFAESLNGLATMLLGTGKYAEGEQLLRQALALQQRLLGKEHPSIAHSLYNLAGALAAQKKLPEAELHLKQSLTIVCKQYGPEHLEVAQTMHRLAIVHARQGQLVEAERLLREALTMEQKLIGSEHRIVADTEMTLGTVLFSLARPEAALSLLSHSARIREQQLRSTSSEVRVHSLLSDLRSTGEEDSIYSLALGRTASPDARRLAMTTALLRKGRALDAGTQANTLLHKSLQNPDLRHRYEEWQRVRQTHEGLLFGGPGNFPVDRYRSRLKEVGLQAEALEAQLLDELPAHQRQQLPGFDEIVSAVAKQLPAQGVLAEFVLSIPFESGQARLSAPQPEPHYLVLLLFPNERIFVFDLGPAQKVDLLAAEFWNALQDPKSVPRLAARSLYQAIMTPLMPQLKGVSDLFLSADGLLNVIPFDALFDGKDYLLGRFRIHYLTSGRDLLRATTDEPATAPLIMANPDFGKLDPGPTIERSNGLYGKLAGLTPLPGSQREAQAIAAMLGVDALVGAQASEVALRQAHSPLVLHVATHGIFLNDVELGTDPSEARALRTLVPLERPKVTADPWILPGTLVPMSRSALLLAGAARSDKAVNSEQDGLLSAQEARSLDLAATQLVVLSACETGQGTASAGQGIYGLRRAFLLAGAATVITSLWKVDDLATGELMTLYYRLLLDKRKPANRLTAMQQAMQTLRHRPGRAHPYYWAPFLVIGSDRPLRPPAAQQPQ